MHSQAGRKQFLITGAAGSTGTSAIVPTTSPLDWKRLLAQPERQWKPGFSAMTLAQSWEAADGDLPPEIANLLLTVEASYFVDVRLILAIPEFQVPLPGGDRPSQTDVLALVSGRGGGTCVLAVEGKVDETFGPTVAEKRAEGAKDRLDYLCKLLELPAVLPGSIRYQLLHRTAASILAAHEFKATAAAMIVHSFSPQGHWYEDFAAFARLLGVDPQQGRLASVGTRGGVALYVGWAPGDQRFRQDLSTAAG